MCATPSMSVGFSVGDWADWEGTPIHKNILPGDALIMSHHIFLGVLFSIS